MNEITVATPESNNGGMMAVNFDLQSVEGKKRMFNGLNTPESLDKAGVEVLELEGICVTAEDELDAATGEVTTVLKTTFFTTDGHNYFSKSFGIGRSAIALVKACDGKIPEGCKVEVFETALDGKRTMKQLRWV